MLARDIRLSSTHDRPVPEAAVIPVFFVRRGLTMTAEDKQSAGQQQQWMSQADDMLSRFTIAVTQSYHGPSAGQRKEG
jgi:hypothetical protein